MTARKSAVSQTPVIAIVDDDASVCEAIQGLLKASGFTSETFLSAEEFMRSERASDAKCLITDVKLGRGMSGLQLQNHLNAIGSRIPIIVVTAFPEDGRRALASEAVCFLSKPVMREDLLASIRLALDRTQGP